MSNITKIIIAFLLVFNIGALTALVYQHQQCNNGHQSPGQSKGGGGIEVLAEDLGFSDEQFQQLKALREAHFEGSKNLHKQMHDKRRTLHQLIKDPNVSPETIDSMATAIGNAHRDMEMHVFKHFTDIKSICNPAQQKQFNETLNKILGQMRPPHAPGPPPRNGKDGRKPPQP